MKKQILSLIILFSLVAIFYKQAASCSMYKITYQGKTLVGTNFDAYYLTPRIWFEIAKTQDEYGAVFSGGRIDGADGIAPQSGMNEAGLGFSRLAAPTPETGIINMSDKKSITHPSLYLKEILHHCKNIDEVKKFISEYDHSYFLQDVFIYIEKSGRYLIVEPYNMSIGNDSTYVLSNFCPSVTTSAYAHHLNRYHHGFEYLKYRQDSTLEFATNLIDTMHVCRSKLGDGTLLSSIWDLKLGMVSIYFYHDYKHLVQFNLNEELCKGDHMLDITKLFPQNAEFEKLFHYQLPQNNMKIRIAFVFCIFVFGFSFLYFLFSYFKKKKVAEYSASKLIIVILGFVLSYYLVTIVIHTAILYSAAPYKDYKFSILDIASYIPIVSLPFFIWMFYTNWKIVLSHTWTKFAKFLFSLNSIAYLILIILFSYWELYSVW